MSDIREALGGVAEALESRKLRDAQELAEMQHAIAALDDSRRNIETAIAEAAASLEADDLSGSAAFASWATAQQRILRAIAVKRAEYVAEEAVRRDKLARSNGEVKAVERLSADARREAAEQAKKAVMRRLGG